MPNQPPAVLGLDTDPAPGGVAGECCAGLAAPLGDGTAAELAAVFKALGDPVRLRLLSLIASRSGPGGEACVCELTPAFDLSQPTISHHLKLLKQAGLIDGERRGTWVYYRLVRRPPTASPHSLPAPASPSAQQVNPPTPATSSARDSLSRSARFRRPMHRRHRRSATAPDRSGFLQV